MRDSRVHRVSRNGRRSTRFVAVGRIDDFGELSVQSPLFLGSAVRENVDYPVRSDRQVAVRGTVGRADQTDRRHPVAFAIRAVFATA